MKSQSIVTLFILITMVTACTFQEKPISDTNTVQPLPTSVVPATSNRQTETISPDTISESKTNKPSDILDLDGTSDELKRIAEFLSENQEVHLATVGADGNPSIHTFLFCYFTGGRIYFLTSKAKPVYTELTNTELVEFIVTTKDSTQSLSVKGSVAFDETYDLIDRALTLYPNIKKIYGSADNPNLTMFYIEHGSAQIFEFSDERQEITLKHTW